jgi:AcrR family transcriptional regulator
MPTASSPAPEVSRIERRRAAVIEEALEHAVAIMTDGGVGALSVSEVARRMGMRGPSLYKYFPSLHAMYDALFARGLAEERAAVLAAMDGLPRGVPRLHAAAAAIVRWCVEHPALAQLLHWRPVPGFEPSAETFAASVQDWEDERAEFAEAVRLGQLSPAADSDEAARLYTVILSGLISQQMANQPGASFAEGAFTRLTDTAVEIFLAAYEPPPPPTTPPAP